MWLLSGKCKSKARLDGKTAVITGSNCGIGYEAAKEFYTRGCRVIMACRDVKKAVDARKQILKETLGGEGVGTLVVVRLDLASFTSVVQCAKHLLATEPAIHLLINNAGLAFYPKSLTEDGFETHFGVNHLSHFLLTLLLLPRIITSAPARIISVSSVAHRGATIDFDDINMDRSYNPIKGYMRSKLANILFTRELGKRLKDRDTGVTTYVLHPGVVNTEVFRYTDSMCWGSQWVINTFNRVVNKTPEQGVQTTIYCAVDEKIASDTGEYYSDCKKTSPSSKARDPALALRLWEESLKMVGLEDYDPFKQEQDYDQLNQKQDCDQLNREKILGEAQDVEVEEGECTHL